jgi:uncharacterized protein (TIGR02271 family)
MRSTERIEVTGSGGLRGVLLDSPSNDPDELVRVQLDDTRVLELPAGLLRSDRNGSYTLPFGPEDIERMAQESASSRTVIPVVAEELELGKRAVSTGGVRIQRHVLEQEEEIDMPLLSEHVQVRRVLLDREVEGPLPIREEGDTLIIPVVEEVLIISRRFRLKEEVHVRKLTRREQHRERITVRRQEAEIQEFDRK